MRNIQSKIVEMEEQLQRGGQDIERAFQQHQELEETEAQLQERLEEEEKIKRELEEAEERGLIMEKHYQSKQEELQEKTKILKKLWGKFQEKRTALDDLEDEFEVEKEDLINTIRELDRQLKLKNLVLDSFIPPHYVEVIESRSQWDPYNDSWVIPGLEYAGNNIERPETRFEGEGHPASSSLTSPTNLQSPVGLRSPVNINNSSAQRSAGTVPTSNPTPKDSFFKYNTKIKKKSKRRAR